MAEAIHIELLSATTFSRGEGTAGEVDSEIVHDDLGMPEIPGRRLRGLLRDAWLAMADAFPSDAGFAREALGVEGDLGPAGARLWIGNARLPEAVRAWVAYACRRRSNPVAPDAILRAFTAVRSQTARNRKAGGAETGTLRATRVLLPLPGLPFIAPLRIRDYQPVHWKVLARACLGVREGGTGRNRGRGSLRLCLWDQGRDVTVKYAGV